MSAALLQEVGGSNIIDSPEVRIELKMGSDGSEVRYVVTVECDWTCPLN